MTDVSSDLEILLDQAIEEAWADDTPPTCQASVHFLPGKTAGHTCTVIARWVCYNQCTGRAVLWCDARYARHLQTVHAGWLCRNCDEPCSHWTVTAL